VRARLAFQPLCEGDSGSLYRLAPGPRPVVCLVAFRVPRTCSQADAARAASPPYAARAAQPSTLPLQQVSSQKSVDLTSTRMTRLTRPSPARNRRRRHSSLGMLTPIEFEARATIA